MQLEIEDEGVGTLTWQLPADISVWLDKLPKVAQAAALADIGAIFSKFLCAMVGGLHRGRDVEKAYRHLTLKLDEHLAEQMRQMKMLN